MSDNRFLHKEPNDSLSDDSLLIALKNRDETAIRHIYQANWPMILQMVKLNNGDTTEAKDLYQDSILDFLEKVWSGNLVLTCKIRTFIYSICRRKWLYQLRGRPQFVDIEEHIEVGNLTTEEAGEEENMPDDKQIVTAINALGEPCRSLLIGFYYEKLSMEQLAAKLNYKSMNVAKQQKFRCKDRLKESLSAWL